MFWQHAVECMLGLLAPQQRTSFRHRACIFYFYDCSQLDVLSWQPVFDRIDSIMRRVLRRAPWVLVDSEAPPPSVEALATQSALLLHCVRFIAFSLRHAGHVKDFSSLEVSPNKSPKLLSACPYLCWPNSNCVAPNSTLPLAYRPEKKLDVLHVSLHCSDRRIQMTPHASAGIAIAAWSSR